jgi:pimeloyl-ACP methyl ester carboxylesterase
VEQRHYAGEHDAVVPAALVTEAVRLLGSAPAVEILPGVGHLDGWAAVWPGILAGQTAAVRGGVQRNE